MEDCKHVYESVWSYERLVFICEELYVICTVGIEWFRFFFILSVYLLNMIFFIEIIRLKGYM
jgi:hypothetical protein